MKCTSKNNNKVLFNDTKSSCESTTCKIEDGQGPDYEIKITPYKNTYYIDDSNPKITITISDDGVGLKENQKLTYQWYRNTSLLGSEKTLDFENDYYDYSATKSIEVPDHLNNISDPTTYKVVIKGTLYDVNNNSTPLNNETHSLYYFIGKLTIQMNANGGQLTTPYNHSYSISDKLIYRNSSSYIHTIKYKGKLGTDGLLDYNDTHNANITKIHYYIDSGSEWNTKKDGSGKSYDQRQQYEIEDFGHTYNDLKRNNYNKVLYANWKPNIYTLTYDSDKGSECSPKSAPYGTKWGTLCTPTRLGYRFNGWKDGNTTIDENTPVSGNITVKADWIMTAGYIQIRYHVNGGQMNSAHGSSYSISSSYVQKDGNTIIHKIKFGEGLTSSGLINYNNSKAVNIYRTGYHINSGSEWNTSANGSGTTYNQTTAYAGSDFCDSLNGDCTVDLYANWKINVCTITFSPNGGKFGKNANNTTHTLNYGKSKDNFWNANGGTYSATNGYYYPKPKHEWISGSRTYDETKGYSASEICPNLGNDSQSVTLKVNWFYEHCQSGNIINNQTVPKSDADKSKNFKVKTFHWSYSKKECDSKSERYRKYDFKEICCLCKIDKNSNRFCNSVTTYDITDYTHPNHATFVRYQMNSNGKDACEAKKKVNSYVTIVCTENISSSTYYHGYYFYNGAVGDYSSFSSDYWTHTGGDYNNRVKAGSSATEACKKACSIKY